MKITIPSDFIVTQLTSVTGSGGYLNTNPTFTLSSSNYAIALSSINDNYIPPLSYLYIVMSIVTMPIST
jgi:hypothetical protein